MQRLLHHSVNRHLADQFTNFRQISRFFYIKRKVAIVSDPDPAPDPHLDPTFQNQFYKKIIWNVRIMTNTISPGSKAFFVGTFYHL